MRAQAAADAAAGVVLLHAELEDAAAAGIPISPSMMGPHPEEHLTQMEVFFKQFTYPEHKTFIL